MKLYCIADELLVYKGTSSSTAESLKQFSSANDLRMNSYTTEINYYDRSMKSQFKSSDRKGARFVVIIGEDEMANDYLTVKNNSTKEEYKLETAYLVNFLDEKLQEVGYDDCCCGHDDCDDDCHCHHE